jgi:hypothetical protein
MNIVLVLLGISVVVWLAAFLANRIADHYNKLPHFVWNRVGGVLAVASITDYQRVRTKVDGMVLVKETLTLSDNPHSPRTINTTRECLIPDSVACCRDLNERKNLFVPFTSERYLPFSEQENIFTPNPDAWEFAERKKRENQEADSRLWFRDLIDSNYGKLLGTQCVCVILAILCVFALESIALQRSDDRADREPIIVYTTTPSGTVTEIHTTHRKEYGLLLNSDRSEADDMILSGVVTELLPIGGGITQVCISMSRSPGEWDCGSVDSSLHINVGDVAYLKPYPLLQWNRREHVRRNSVNIVITEAEAKQLQATGKFTITK